MEYFFQTRERLFFVMPFINGGELYRIFRAVGKFREHVTRFFATQIIIGVGKLHELNITHRDLKLENFMVDTDGYLQIIDFGLAGIIPQDKLSTTTCGTKEYFAPEIV